ncbi:MAG: hypothetical protein AVDCRST_MAG89-2534, partial [uncultured Gemmatimonadetes bacterium]
SPPPRPPRRSCPRRTRGAPRGCAAPRRCWWPASSPRPRWP